MIKKQYLEEIALHAPVSTGSVGTDVKKVQEWLNLWRYIDPAWKQTTTVDSHFGAKTGRVVQLFQARHNLLADGIVGPKTFAQLTAPMIQAFAKIDKATLGERITAIAEQHLANRPRELDSANRGPWVRAYMDGHEGRDWPWCMGFVQTVLDQAFAAVGEKFTTAMTHSYSCDEVALYGRSHGNLVPYATLRTDPDAHLKQGDIFLVRRGTRDWVHTGIITGIEDKLLHTIEGNTNDEGSREGIEVCRRVRSLERERIDGFKLKG